MTAATPPRRRIVRAIRPSPPREQGAAAANNNNNRSPPPQVTPASGDDAADASSVDSDMPALLEYNPDAASGGDTSATAGAAAGGAAAAGRRRNNHGNNSAGGGGPRGNRYAALAGSGSDDDDDDDSMPPLLEPDGRVFVPPAREVEEIDSDEDDDDDYDEDYDDEDDEDDYYDDDDDDEDYDEDFDEMAGFMRRFMVSMGDESDEDDDDDFCDCPRCAMRRFMEQMGGPMRIEQMGGPMGGFSARLFINNNNNAVDESLDDTEGTVDENAPTCAVCLEHESSKRKLVCLPCCGEKEEASSTRFCQKCLDKCIKTRSVRAQGGYRIGECPRCKRLLAAKKGGVVEIRKATPSQMFKYIVEQPQRFHFYLVTAAWVYNDFLPMQLLDLKQNGTASQECVSRLVQWGLLQKKSSSSSSNSTDDDVYRIDRNLQTDLREFCRLHLKADFDGDIEAIPLGNADGNVRPQYIMTSVHCLGSAWESLKQRPLRQLGRTLRLCNRAVTLLLAGGGMLPDLSVWHRPVLQGYVVTGLNVGFVYLLGKILGHAVWIVGYAGTGLAAAFLTGWWMKAPPPKHWKRSVRNLGTGCFVLGTYLYFGGRFGFRGLFSLVKGAVGWGWASHYHSGDGVSGAAAGGAEL